MRTVWVLPLLLLLASCKREAPKAALPPPLVRAVDVVLAGDGPLELRGTVAARSRIKLGFKVAGVVAAVLVREGDAVRQGQVLARLEDADAKTLVLTAQAGADKARRDAARTERLAAEGALPTNIRDDARSALETAEAQLAQARDLLDHTRLRAPEAGTIFARTGEPGEVLGVGNPVLELDSTGDLVVRCGASEPERARLRPGEPVTLVVEEDGRERRGVLRSLATSPSPADGLYPLEVVPASGPLQPGAMVRVAFPGRPGLSVPAVPLEALVRRADRDQVFVLSGGRVQLREVTVLRSEGGLALVRKGLRAGERVVGEGAYFLQDGQAVRVSD